MSHYKLNLRMNCNYQSFEAYLKDYRNRLQEFLSVDFLIGLPTLKVKELPFHPQPRNRDERIELIYRPTTSLDLFWFSIVSKSRQNPPLMFKSFEVSQVNSKQLTCTRGEAESLDNISTRLNRIFSRESMCFALGCFSTFSTALPTLR